MDKLSNHSVDETAEKLQVILRAKGIALFSLCVSRSSTSIERSPNENSGTSTSHQPDALVAYPRFNLKLLTLGFA
jgi:hypothetical protein